MISPSDDTLLALDVGFVTRPGAFMTAFARSGEPATGGFDPTCNGRRTCRKGPHTLRRPAEEGIDLVRRFKE